MDNMQEQLFQAMEKIARSVIETNSSSKIVKGQIISETVNSDGAYDVSYLGSTIKVFPQNESLKYKKGEFVLILLPNGQLNEKKIILNTAESRPDTSPDIDDSIQDAIDSIITTGRNYIASPLVGVELNQNVNKIPITIDPMFYRHYMASQSHMRIRSKVTSEITRSLVTADFSFGISITIQYEDKSERTFDFNYLNMEGNVYNLIGNVQDIVFEIPVEKAPINAYGEFYLLNPTTNSADHIIFSETRLELLSDILADIITNKRYTVRIFSDSGTVFDEGDNKNIKLICQIISEQGIDVDPWGLSFDYEWYEITFDADGNKIKPAEPFSRKREVLIDLGAQDNGTKYYECEVYPKTQTIIKKLDI